MEDKIQQALQNMIKNLEEMTGKSIDEWIAIAQNSGHENVRSRTNYLKSEHGLTHGYANRVALMAKDREQAAEIDKPFDPVEAVFAGSKAHLRPIYDRILAAARGFGDDFVEAPKRHYVSLRRNKQFAIIQPSTRTRVDVGLVLKEAPAAGRLETAGSWNSMCSHRVRLEKLDDVNDELLAWLKEAYDAA